MKTNLLAIAVLVGAFSTLNTSAAVRYVDVNSASPTPPFTSWATAATNIQDAVDAAVDGDQILVTNGVYQTGGQAYGTMMTNRVAVDKAVTVQSVNGPALTVIRGFQVPGTTNGDGAVRCVHLLVDGAALVGFTLTNGATRASGDTPHGDYGPFGGGVLSESASAVVSNCTLAGNSAAWAGGGAFGGTLNNCTLTANSVFAGGGGGASSAILNNCMLIGNSAGYGGGASDCTLLNNCTLTGNSGGGSFRSALNNCTITGNSGAGAFVGTLTNCTITGNSGVGVFGQRITGPNNTIEYAILHNCIVYYNQGGNYSLCLFEYSCTTPLPSGVGNISAEPQLASSSHLSADSPCRGAGSATYATGADIDGEAWANPPSIGCDEYHSGAETGPLSVAIEAGYTNVATGFEVNFTAQINGQTSLSRWDFGDGTGATNRPFNTAHGWAVPGDYPVVLWAYNGSHPGGVSATVIVHVLEQVHYVSQSSSNPAAPYNSWVTAATNIQDAVDAASVVGALVLVTNGVYQTGGRVVDGAMTNRVAVTKLLTLRSVNGQEVTVIRGYQLPGTTNGDGAIRCVYLAKGASLSGFTLTNGATRVVDDYPTYRESSGGGVWCESATAAVSNCTFTGNSANSGGGAYLGTLNNCTLTGNSADNGGGGVSESILNNCTLIGNSADYGGAALYGILNNCTLTGNSAEDGGGVYGGTLNNCTVYFNTASTGANFCQNQNGGVLNYCCTTPLPTNGIANLTNAPLFVDYAGGNLRLQTNSPCINSGFNGFAPAGPDLDGNPRIAGGTVDIGAYEFQSPTSVISYAWLQKYGLPTDGSADHTDSDSDRLNNWQEWRAGTDPTNALSVLQMLSPMRGASGLTVSWESVSSRNYFLERSINLGAQPPVSTLVPNILGQAVITTFTDTNAAGAGTSFTASGCKNSSSNYSVLKSERTWWKFRAR